MRWNRFVISILLLYCTHSMMADSIHREQPVKSRYELHTDRYRERWSALIPTQFVIQNAGNMGALSSGIGWDYGKHWETQLLFGFIPKHHSTRGKLTITLKENYIPWSIDIRHGWSAKPLSASLYLNTVYGHEFWRSQPSRYPDGYYQFMSTKFRLNAALGQQITWQIPDNRSKRAKSITVFYELSTCDLDIRAKVIEHSIPLKDIVGLSFGVKFQTL